MEVEEIPMNELDLAIMELGKVSDNKTKLSFIRALVKGELWFMTKMVPEHDGQTMTISDGMPNPFLEMETPKSNGRFVPIYSSRERLEESMKALKVEDEPVGLGLMDARIMLTGMGAMKLRPIVNKRCKTGDVELPHQLLIDIGNGKF